VLRYAKRQLLRRSGWKIVPKSWTAARYWRRSGLYPAAPGNTGNYLAIPFSLALNRIALNNFLFATVLLIGAIAGAVWLCSLLAGRLKPKDPQFIVIDEIVGFLLANFLAPLNLTALLWSFALFRFFDISKIFPANRLEQLPHGAGIVLDDWSRVCTRSSSLRLLVKMGWA
jgi:phosphatidylglycerophosphatase A